jgi:hypothetical protein
VTPVSASFADEDQFYHSNNRAPLSSPAIRRLRATASRFGYSDGYFHFQGNGTFIIRKTLLHFGFKYNPKTGYILRVPPAL